MQMVPTHSLLAMTPAMSVEPLLPPKPTSITLQPPKMVTTQKSASCIVDKWLELHCTSARSQHVVEMKTKWNSEKYGERNKSMVSEQHLKNVLLRLTDFRTL
jgi:hypothetical protein